ncbi:MAG: nuclear transport factor 2 family protein [Bacteroidales bacterium]|nr:nuclear transport factor 2 family protein [Bacteroidales bacterium]
MKTSLMKVVFISLAALIILSCAEQRTSNVNADAEKAIIEKVIRNSIGWAKEKDLQLLYSVIADDSCYIEVQPTNRVVRGIAEFKKAEEFWMHPEFKAVRFETRDMTINISQSGTVAWWYCMLDDINTWKGQAANWENTRWTGVLEKRNGNWVIVQMHFSFANE